jgi:hypothetical protein
MATFISYKPTGVTQTRGSSPVFYIDKAGSDKCYTMTFGSLNERGVVSLRAAKKQKPKVKKNTEKSQSGFNRYNAKSDASLGCLQALVASVNPYSFNPSLLFMTVALPPMTGDCACSIGRMLYNHIECHIKSTKLVVQPKVYWQYLGAKFGRPTLFLACTSGDPANNYNEADLREAWRSFLDTYILIPERKRKLSFKNNAPFITDTWKAVIDCGFSMFIWDLKKKIDRSAAYVFEDLRIDALEKKFGFSVHPQIKQFWKKEKKKIEQEPFTYHPGDQIDMVDFFGLTPEDLPGIVKPKVREITNKHNTYWDKYDEFAEMGVDKNQQRIAKEEKLKYTDGNFVGFQPPKLLSETYLNPGYKEVEPMKPGQPVEKQYDKEYRDLNAPLPMAVFTPEEAARRLEEDLREAARTKELFDRGTEYEKKRAELLKQMSEAGQRGESSKPIAEELSALRKEYEDYASAFMRRLQKEDEAAAREVKQQREEKAVRELGESKNTPPPVEESQSNTTDCLTTDEKELEEARGMLRRERPDLSADEIEEYAKLQVEAFKNLEKFARPRLFSGNVYDRQKEREEAEKKRLEEERKKKAEEDARRILREIEEYRIREEAKLKKEYEELIEREREQIRREKEKEAEKYRRAYPQIVFPDSPDDIEGAVERSLVETAKRVAEGDKKYKKVQTKYVWDAKKKDSTSYTQQVERMLIDLLGDPSSLPFDAETITCNTWGASACLHKCGNRLHSGDDTLFEEYVETIKTFPDDPSVEPFSKTKKRYYTHVNTYRVYKNIDKLKKGDKKGVYAFPLLYNESYRNYIKQALALDKENDQERVEQDGIDVVIDHSCEKNKWNIRDTVKKLLHKEHTLKYSDLEYYSEYCDTPLTETEIDVTSEMYAFDLHTRVKRIVPELMSMIFYDRLDKVETRFAGNELKERVYYLYLNWYNEMINASCIVPDRSCNPNHPNAFVYNLLRNGAYTEEEWRNPSPDNLMEIKLPPDYVFESALQQLDTFFRKNPDQARTASQYYCTGIRTTAGKAVGEGRKRSKNSPNAYYNKKVV